MSCEDGLFLERSRSEEGMVAFLRSLRAFSCFWLMFSIRQFSLGQRVYNLALKPAHKPLLFSFYIFNIGTSANELRHSSHGGAGPD